MTPYWNVYKAFFPTTVKNEWGDLAQTNTEQVLRKL